MNRRDLTLKLRLKDQLKVEGTPDAKVAQVSTGEDVLLVHLHGGDAFVQLGQQSMVKDMHGASVASIQIPERNHAPTSTPAAEPAHQLVTMLRNHVEVRSLLQQVNLGIFSLDDVCPAGPL